MRRFCHAVLCLLLAGAECRGETTSYGLNLSEPVVVVTTGGTPRLRLTLDGQTRYAACDAAASTNTRLVFSDVVQAGDFARAGKQVVPAVDLDGGTIRDLSGNPLVPDFSMPADRCVRIQTDTAGLATRPITSANASSIGFTISHATISATFAATITSSNDSRTISSSGTINGISHTVSHVDVSGLAAGTLTLSVSATASGKTCEAQSITVRRSLTGPIDGVPPAGADRSTYRLRAAYLAPLMRLGRFSDNAQQDIGATIDRLNGVPAPVFDGVHPRRQTSVAMTSNVDSIWSTHFASVLGDGGGGIGRIWGMSSNPSLGSWLVGNPWSLPRALHGNLQALVFGWGTSSTTDRQPLERWLSGLAGIAVP